QCSDRFMGRRVDRIGAGHVRALRITGFQPVQSALRVPCRAHGLKTGDTLGLMTSTQDIDRLWDWHDPAATEAKFRALLLEAQKSGDVGYQIELLTQIARTHSMRREFDQSHALLDQAENLMGTDDSKLPR